MKNKTQKFIFIQRIRKRNRITFFTKPKITKRKEIIMNLYLIPTIKLNSLLGVNHLYTTFSFGYNPLQALHNAKVTLLSFGIEEAYHLSAKCESY